MAKKASFHEFSYSFLPALHNLPRLPDKQGCYKHADDPQDHCYECPFHPLVDGCLAEPDRQQGLAWREERGLTGKQPADETKAQDEPDDCRPERASQLPGGVINT